MAGNIYLIPGSGGLVPLTEQPYESEALLQSLLSEYPALLAGEQLIDGNPRRWLLVSREAPIPNPSEDATSSWYLDHLFLDQDGIPTLVEVKRSTDTRARRAVVGQMLDYAANIADRWTAEEIRAHLSANVEAESRMSEFFAETNLDEFWTKVELNLKGGRMRLVFLADVIPPELRKIVEFLASQFRFAEIFAVEVRNYQGGDGHRALVPRLVSSPKEQSAAAAATANSRQWDATTFFEELKQRRPECVVVAEALAAWAREHMNKTFFGSGATAGSLIPVYEFTPDRRLFLFALWTSGSLQMYLQYLRVPPFDTEDRRRELIRSLNTIPGIVIPEDAHRGRPSFDMNLLVPDASRARFLEIMTEAVAVASTSSL